MPSVIVEILRPVELAGRGLRPESEPPVKRLSEIFHKQLIVICIIRKSNSIIISR